MRGVMMLLSKPLRSDPADHSTAPAPEAPQAPQSLQFGEKVQREMAPLLRSRLSVGDRRLIRTDLHRILRSTQVLP